MATIAEQLKEVSSLLAKGDVAGAQKVLAEKPSDAPADSATPAAPPAPPVKREPPEIVLDLFKAIGNLLGNHPALTPLLNELEEAIAPAKDAKEA